MGIKAFLGQVWADLRTSQVNKSATKAWELQQNTFHHLIGKARDTSFGKTHQFDQIKSIADFQQRVPVRNYEQNKEYFDRIYKGEANVSWPGKPEYLAKTSGTTSGSKYIPITKESIAKQIAGARDALMAYISETKKTGFLNGKMMFLSGSPVIESNEFGIRTGRLSGIVNHFVPAYLQTNKVPTYETNSIEDWETKVSTIVKEIHNQDLRLISGIPPWVQMLFEELESQTGKKPLEAWPNLQLFVQGGVDYAPYKPIFDHYFGDQVDTVEVYPASEGFFALQTSQQDNGLMLMPDYGIFYEFIPLEEYGKEGATRLTLNEVELDKQYALIISTNAGLWAYDIGDTVKFVSLNPYKLRVSGRVKHFISAFGEHVISEEVNRAMVEACANSGAEVQEFTVAPMIREEKGDSCHEWWIEFQRAPSSMEDFAELIDISVQKQNPYYKDLREGSILKKAVIKPLKLNAAREYMKSKGKLGGQNKFPRLSNNREIVEALESYLLD